MEIKGGWSTTISFSLCVFCLAGLKASWTPLVWIDSFSIDFAYTWTICIPLTVWLYIIMKEDKLRNCIEGADRKAFNLNTLIVLKIHYTTLFETWCSVCPRPHIGPIGSNAFKFQFYQVSPSTYIFTNIQNIQSAKCISHLIILHSFFICSYSAQPYSNDHLCLLLGGNQPISNLKKPYKSIKTG